MRPSRSYKFLAAALATVLFFATNPGNVSAASHWRTDFHQAEAEAKRDGKLLLLHFHASWCGPCRRMNSEVLSSAKLARLLGTQVIAVKVDSDRYPGVVSRFGIHSLPSDVFLQPDGKILGRTSGYQAASTYLRTVSSFSARFARQRRDGVQMPRMSMRKLFIGRPLGITTEVEFCYRSSRFWFLLRLSTDLDGVSRHRLSW